MFSKGPFLSIVKIWYQILTIPRKEPLENIVGKRESFGNLRMAIFHFCRVRLQLARHSCHKDSLVYVHACVSACVRICPDHNFFDCHDSQCTFPWFPGVLFPGVLRTVFFHSHWLLCHISIVKQRIAVREE